MEPREGEKELDPIMNFSVVAQRKFTRNVNGSAMVNIRQNEL